jgi:hypothetical protein
MLESIASSTAALDVDISEPYAVAVCTICYDPRIFFIIIWFVRLLALRPILAYCASLG